MRKTFVIGALGLVAIAAVAAVGRGLWSGTGADRPPPLVEPAPLQPLTRTSVIIAPTAIALTAIRDSLETMAPRNLTGQRPDPLRDLLSNAELGWNVTRGPLAVAGRADGLTVTTSLSGVFRLTGQLSAKVGDLGAALGGLLGGSIGRELQNVTGRTLDQRADLRGNVTMTARPTIAPTWRLEPNLQANVSLADAALTVAGVRLSVGNEAKPLIERSVAEQVALLQSRLRTDPFIEAAARREWQKLCRAIPLGAAGAGLPALWLELRPTRAFAAQPRTDARAVTLVLGVQAETRITPSQTTPDCPFPANLDIVPQTEQGRVRIGLPIDVPLAEVSRLVDARLKGRTFPDDRNGAYELDVQGATIAASGDRLLISVRVKGRETKSWFGFAADATVHVWGRPVLDRADQSLRLADVSLAVESETAFGLLGTAARAILPYLQDAVAQNAVIDLKPLLANARANVASAVSEFRQARDGVRVEAQITDLRLADIAFDARTLRIVAEAEGTATVDITSLSGL
jgi:hypothetical protein